jgi:hypothetical protein
MIVERIARRAACLLLLGCAFFAWAEEKPKNLVENGSLEGELGDNGLPRDWFSAFQPEKGFRFEVVKGGRTGDKALLIEGKGDWGVVVANRVAIEPKKQYRARGWVKAQGDGKPEATLKIDYYDADQKWIGQTWAGAVDVGTKEWQPVVLRDRSIDFPQAKYLAVGAALTHDGKAWFDDLELTAFDAPKPTGNLLPNGDFEDQVSERPALWNIAVADGGSITCRRIPAKPKESNCVVHLQGNGEWGVAGSERIALDKKKTYTLTGYARAKSGTVALAISYWQNDKYLGNTLSEGVTNERQSRKVIAEPDKFPEATHISAVVGWHEPGEAEAWFDTLVLTAK